MPAIYRVRISPADVGSRVSVRIRLPTSSPRPGQYPGTADQDSGKSDQGPGTTDVVGWLRSWDDAGLSIERRDGSMVQVTSADLLAGRTVPPPVERRRR